jgi:hypothetical protein
MAFAFTPVTGLRDTTVYLNEPTDPRGDVQGMMDQIRDHYNTHLADIATLYANEYGFLYDGTDESTKLKNMFDAIPSTGARLAFDRTKQITYNTNAVVSINNKQNVIVEGCNIKGSSGSVFYVGVGSKNIVFRDCVFEDVGQCVYLHACSQIIVDSCKFTHTGYGIIQQNGYVSDNVKVINCIAENMVNDLVSCNCETASPSKNWIVNGNHFLGNSLYPTIDQERRFFSATNVRNINISNNIIENTAGESAIELENSGGNVVICGNVLKDCVGTAYVYIINNEKDVIISNNFFESTELTNLASWVYYWSSGGNTQKLIFNANICKGHSALKDVFLFDASLTNSKIISNNEFIGFDILFDNKKTNNVTFVNNYVEGATGIVFTTPSTGQMRDWIISGNKFVTTNKALDLAMNTGGTAFPLRMLIYGNYFNGDVSITQAHYVSFYGNLLATGKTVVFPTTGFYENSVCFNNLVEGVGMNPTDNYILGHIEKSGTVVWDPGSLDDGVGVTLNDVVVTGAVLGDFVLVSAPYDLQGIVCSASIQATNYVRIRLQNETGGTIDLASGTWKVRVIK